MHRFCAAITLAAVASTAAFADYVPANGVKYEFSSNGMKYEAVTIETIGEAWRNYIPRAGIPVPEVHVTMREVIGTCHDDDRRLGIVMTWRMPCWGAGDRTPIDIDWTTYQIGKSVVDVYGDFFERNIIVISAPISFGRGASAGSATRAPKLSWHPPHIPLPRPPFL